MVIAARAVRSVNRKPPCAGSDMPRILPCRRRGWIKLQNASAHKKSVPAQILGTPSVRTTERGAGLIRTGDGGFAIRPQTPENTGKTGISEHAGADAGALETKTAQFDADLQALIDAWPDLPEAVRSTVLTVVAAHVRPADCR